MPPSGIKTWLPSEVYKQNFITNKLIELYEKSGFKPIMIPTLVDISLIEKANSKFTAEVFKLVDRDGRTLALRTELTQPIAKEIASRAQDLSFPVKLYYNSSIFRYRGIATDDSREIQQIGVEYIGGQNSDKELLELLINSAEVLGIKNYLVTLTHSSIWQRIFKLYGDPKLSLEEELNLKSSSSLAYQVYKLLITGDVLGFKNLITEEHPLKALLSDDITELEKALDIDLQEFKKLLKLSPNIRFDPLQIPDLKLYTGLHFNLVVASEGRLVAMGGRYDNLCKSFGTDLPAIGFAFYLPRLISLMSAQGLLPETKAISQSRDKTLRIAVSKGTMLDGAIKYLQSQGFEIEGIENKRKLILQAKHSSKFSNFEKIEILNVRGHDVPVYVDHGSADLGIVGNDVVLDSKTNVVKIKDLNYGACRLCVCARQGVYKSITEIESHARIATTFPNITREFFDKRGLEVEIINLYGSVELGPLTDLSDIIVDLVATGTTLKENGLEVIETILNCSATLIANPISFKVNQKEFLSL